MNAEQRRMRNRITRKKKDRKAREAEYKRMWRDAKRAQREAEAMLLRELGA